MRSGVKPSTMKKSTTRTTYSSQENARANRLPFESPAFDKDKHMPKNEVVAILCPGPNLELYDPQSEYGLVIGVNRASVFHECDWLVALDVSGFERQNVFTKKWCDVNGYPKGKPRVFSGGISALKKITDWLPDKYEMPAKFPGELNWPWKSYSLFGAMMLAYRLGAEKIHCYGVFWDGNLDFDGKSFSSRNAARWMTEKFMFKQAKEWLATKGVMLCRIIQPIGEEDESKLKPDPDPVPTHIEAGMTLGVSGGEFSVKVDEDEEYQESVNGSGSGDGGIPDDGATDDLTQEEIEGLKKIDQ